MNKKTVRDFIFICLVAVGCTAGEDRTNIEWIQGMMKQPAVKAQRKEGEIGVRMPPEGTYALNQEYYPHKGDLDSAIQNLKNPIKENYSTEIILIGKRHYQKACIYCHGEKADGEGPMKNSMIVLPPSLLVQKAKDLSDAQMYHIIYEGQGMMGAYRMQVRDPKFRWALINYIRTLQKAAPL
ncbi:MAG: cytochrome c [Bdellovibrionales bacterium]|nr:cytochrome c [Bdellovibrionales bacterium]